MNPQNRPNTLANVDKFVSLGIFWRNDRKEGFGIDTFCKPSDEARAVLRMLEDCYRMFKASPKGEQEEFISEVAPSQLLEAGRLHKAFAKKPELWDDSDARARFMVFGPLNVYILEQEGRLAPVDDFNGCVFVYELGNGTALVQEGTSNGSQGRFVGSPENFDFRPL